MVYEFKFPDVGEGITEGKLVSWKVKVGEEIKIDQSVADVETDKAVVQIPAPVSGTVGELKNKEGDTLNVGEIFMTINEESENLQSVKEEQVETASLHPIGGEEKVQEIPLETKKPDFEIEEVEEIPKEDVSSKKEAVVINGETFHAKEDLVPKIPELQENSIKEQTKEEASNIVEEDKKENSSVNKIENSNQILAMPAIWHEARQKGINLSSIKGTGKHGEITLEDLGGKNTQETQNKNVENKENEIVKGVAPTQNNISSQVNVVPSKKSELSEDLKEIKEEVQKNSAEIKQVINSSEILATPSIRQYAREKGVDLNTIQGSGDNGRITREDVEGIKSEEKKIPQNEEIQVNKNQVEEKIREDSKIQKNSVSLDDVRIPFTQIRSIIAKRMLESQQKTAAVTHTDEANVSDLILLKETEKDHLNEQGVKFSFIPFYIKAFIAAAKKYPLFNSVVDEEKNEIVQRNTYDIGIAVDTENGLLVPVLKDCMNKSIVELCVELVNLATKAKEGKLSPNEMSGSSFTISSVGSLGGQVFTPIINYPEVAILGVGKIVRKPIVNSEDKILIADTITFSLTFDHRVLDGADAARFLKLFISYIENPESLFMEMS